MPYRKRENVMETGWFGADRTEGLFADGSDKGENKACTGMRGTEKNGCWR